jgi:hypothetical protein
MKSKIFLSCFFLILGCNLAFAQFNISLKAENQSLKNDLIKTILIKTSNLKSKNSFGKVYSDSKNLTDINLQKSISAAILKQINTYETNKNAPEIVLDIEIFELSEKIMSKNVISGKIWLEIAASMITDGDTNRMCRARSSVSYQRSFSAKSTEGIGTEVQICVDNCYSYIYNYVKKNKAIFENYAESSKVIIKPFKVMNAKDTVYYQQRKVIWADFSGPVRSRTEYGAAIFASFGYASKLYTDNSQITMEITPKIFMDKNMSWVRNGMKTDYALKHEQLHFDIAYMLSLQFLQKIKTFKAKTEKDLLSLVNYEYLEFYKKMHTVQEQYDDETDHSLNKDKQEKWSLKVKAEIAKFDVNGLYK